MSWEKGRTMRFSRVNADLFRRFEFLERPDVVGRHLSVRLELEGSVAASLRFPPTS